MNLAPHATEEWDDESASLIVCEWCMCMYCAAYRSKYERIHCFTVIGELGMAPCLH